MEIREYFEMALRMDTGEKMVIPVPDAKKQHSTRVTLFQLKRKFSQVSAQMADQIAIYAQTMDNPEKPGTDLLTVVIEKMPIGEKPFIIQHNGTIRKIIPKRSMSKMERMIDRAIEDGLTVEDLIESTGVLFPEEEIRKEWKKQLKERGK